LGGSFHHLACLAFLIDHALEVFAVSQTWAVELSQLILCSFLFQIVLGATFVVIIAGLTVVITMLAAKLTITITGTFIAIMD